MRDRRRAAIAPRRLPQRRDKARSEDSWDAENKPLDFWGYTWTREYRLDRVDYTTGAMFGGGGWFDAVGGGLRVQVRRDGAWRDVRGLVIGPAYPYDASAGPNRTFTLDFRATRGDGVRMADHVTKRYGEKLAVDDVSFAVEPGIVTGFLGPNGAGKSTTMRMILGLDAPSSGTVLVNGRRYRDLEAPLHEVGAMLEA